MSIENIESITIENMLANIFTTTTIKKKRKEIVDFYRQHLVTDLFSTSPDSITEEQIAKRVDVILKDDQKSQTPYLAKGKDGKYYKSRNRGRNIVGPKQTDKIDSNYVGKAGECAVMSELLFNGYNVNNMMVDEGIDIVASKGNVFYYIQVKTRYVDETNRVNFQIKEGNHERYNGTQMRYVLVARAKIGNDIRNIFFVFDIKLIDKFRFNGIIGESDANNISINIEYDTHSGRAFIYNGKNNKKRDDVTYYMNNFNL